jgi:hypothetical protein
MKKVIVITVVCMSALFAQAQNAKTQSARKSEVIQNARTVPTGDTDGDGVLDQLDLEPNTPPGCPVNTHGVRQDTDGDGVPDCKDKQLITPTECQPVDADGVGKCPEPECCMTIKAGTSSIRANNENGLTLQKELLKTQALEIQKLNQKLEELADIIARYASGKGKLNTATEVLKLTSVPNPTTQSFNIKLESNSNQPFTISVRDIVGKLIEERGGLQSKAKLELGRNYRPGTYFIEAVQGSERNTLMLIKQ